MDFRVARVIASLDDLRPGLDDFGRHIRRSDADAVLATAIQTMASNGGHLVIVEDDLARRGDPHLEGVAYVGDRAIRWLELGEGPSLVAQLVRTGGSGYPLNAFVCGSGAGDLGLISDRVLSTEAVSVVARSVTTIISSAFDAESYVLLAVEDLWGTNVE